MAVFSESEALSTFMKPEYVLAHHSVEVVYCRNVLRQSQNRNKLINSIHLPLERRKPN